MRAFLLTLNGKVEKLQAEVDSLKRQQLSMAEQLSKVLQAQLLQQQELEEKLGSSTKPLREADGT